LICGLMPQLGQRPKMVPESHGNKFTIWELPKDGGAGRYLYFGDVGQGLENSDLDYGYILDRVTKRFVAKIEGRLGPDIHCGQAVLLCQFYFNATLAWDITGIGAEMRPIVIQSQYPNIYLRIKLDPNAKSVLTKEDRENAMGFLFTRSTRLMALSCAKVGIEGMTHLMSDPVWFAQAKQFGFDEEGKGPAAASGYLDDAIMASAGACYCDMNMDPPTQTIPLKPGDDANRYRERLARAQKKHASDEYPETGNY